MNWAWKPLLGIVKYGLTVTAEPDMQDFGNDPPNALLLNEVNCAAFTIDLVERTGFVALNGITQALNPEQFTHAPQFTSDLIVTVGSQYPQGGSIGGEVKRKIIRAGLYSEADLAFTTADLRARYA